MKDKNRMTKFSFIGFLLFSMTIGITSTISIVVYYLTNIKSGGNIWIVAISTLSVILIGAFLCSLIDMYRRKTMIEKPVEKILEATKRISSGDFSIQIDHSGEYSVNDPYHIIIDNINIMTRELSKNEMLKNEFVSSVSHELKTPLAVIQNYAKSLLSDKISKEKKKECVEGLVNQSNKLASLVGNILSLSKLENQQIIPKLKKFNLGEFLRVLVINYEPLFEKKEISIDCDIEDIEVLSSENLIEIAIRNLISNAIKFTGCGGKVLVSLREEDGLVIINVKDTGIGISSEVGERIFDKFYQADSSRSAEGNGLGLALVKKVIDILGGTISVESSVGVGSTFTIKIKKD